MSSSVDAPTVTSQMSLPVSLDDAATLENFLARSELAPVLAQAKAEPDADTPTFLHGAAFSGKTHLLQGFCHRFPGAAYLPLGALIDFDAEQVLDGLETAPAVAIDGVHMIRGRGAWEEGLFHLVNRARDAACPLWFASRKPPAESVVLPDLSSRLAAGLVWALAAPNEQDRAAILQFRAKRRGLRLEDAVASYLLARETRTLPAALEALDKLDAASLSAQRPLTIPFVREVMGW